MCVAKHTVIMQNTVPIIYKYVQVIVSHVQPLQDKAGNVIYAFESIETLNKKQKQN